MWRSGCNALLRSLRHGAPAVDQSTTKAAQVSETYTIAFSKIRVRRLNPGCPRIVNDLSRQWRFLQFLSLTKLLAWWRCLEPHQQMMFNSFEKSGDRWRLRVGTARNQ